MVPNRAATLTAWFAFFCRGAGAFIFAVLVSLTPLTSLAQDAPAAAPQKVSGPEISLLIRTTMIALHQANLTGNYTVLRDLGASVLQASNTPADLAARFAQFRESRFNLAPSVLVDAVLDEKPKLSTNGEMKLVGHFSTKPQEIVFDMTFLFEGGIWRIALLQVGSRMAVASAVKETPKAASTKPAKTKAEVEDLAPPAPRPRPKS